MTALTGTGPLLRLALRRDRITLPVWVYLLTASVASTTYSFKKLYGTAASRGQLAASLAGNGSLRALYGPLGDSGIGGITVWRIGVTGAALAAAMSILLVVRHTRAQEEDGRLELIGAGAVARPAPLTAALAAAALANGLLALLTTASLVALGQPLAGSLAFGCSLAACGLVFAGVASVTAQLAETGRAANSLAGAALGLAYVLRAASDASTVHGPGAFDWLSPIGWSEQVQPYGADRWWVLLLSLAVAGLLAGVAYTLVGRRDLGSGLLPQRPGPATAARTLRTPFALAVRLQRGTLAGWCAAFAVAGGVFGAIAKGIVDLVGGNRPVADVLRRMGGQHGVADAYLSSIMGILGMLAAVYAVQCVLRLRAEETEGRAEPVLAGPVSRLGWATGHLLFPLLGSAALLTCGGLAAGAAEHATLGDRAGSVAELLGGALVQLPAVWLTAAAAVLLLGLAPRWTSAGWGVLTAFVLIGWLGPALQADQWVLDLSPFTHTPHLPGGTFAAQPLLWLTLLTAALTAAGLTGLRHRDLG
ncbi:ABC-2 type transport system permease protein [Kitasatospora sp. MAA4]|uniref:ABC transporter permease n=1 Tax=Kitasatospora sp. MAA4 TaxID=3035093 RepID=UPI002474D517|nr:ABC transporter permease [Kitasatospora sp. MAA4]MDH6132275.1 ABC-2 type transport system permease protein [Kitasatospora sp. MAA4]